MKMKMKMKMITKGTASELMGTHVLTMTLRLWLNRSNDAFPGTRVKTKCAGTEEERNRDAEM